MKKQRGMGQVYHPQWVSKSTGERHFSPTCYIRYYYHGKKHEESAHSTKESDAWKLLKKRFGELASGRPAGPDIEKTKFEDLAEMIIADYKANGRRTLGKCKNSVRHLRDFFGDYRAVEITSDRVTAYTASRLEENYEKSAINAELAALTRMFTLGMRAGKVATKPYIAKLHLDNARQGFFEPEEFALVRVYLPDEIKPVAIVAYVTGWRITSEVLTRQKKHLDLNAGWLRLEPGETKNGEGRMFPLTPMLREALEKQVEKTKALEKATGQIIPWLFHRQGKPIKYFRRSWITACIKAGLGKQIFDTRGKVIKRVANKIPHDFRRTAVRNLERAGVSRSAAMKMVGHKTQAIYSRYAIVGENELKEAAVQLSRLHNRDADQKKVVSD